MLDGPQSTARAVTDPGCLAAAAPSSETSYCQCPLPAQPEQVLEIVCERPLRQDEAGHCRAEKKPASQQRMPRRPLATGSRSAACLNSQPRQPRTRPRPAAGSRINPGNIWFRT